MKEGQHNHEKAKAHIWVSGQVQGVFFRQKVKEKAESLRIDGWIRNLPDGRVEAIFEGDKDTVEGIIRWIREEPDSARVEDVEVKWKEYKDEFHSFKIK